MTDLRAGRELDALIDEKVMGYCYECHELSRKSIENDPETARIIKEECRHESVVYVGDEDDVDEVGHRWWYCGRHDKKMSIGVSSRYSTDKAAALEVVDVLTSIEWGFALFKYPGLSSNGFGYVVAFARSLRPYSLEIVMLGDPEKVKHAHSNSLPEAICLAAIQTVDGMR